MKTPKTQRRKKTLHQQRRRLARQWRQKQK
ncbi:unnamed protein product [Acanthoscelides obtectus]|uniref:Uncharacterized protein n=1 Tax=Acanthoscelides obtectus TaxID=200917 RepID=A0A9P0P0Q3_ACAOB|nr:unnamed protein product [Acanthoscelides obtectus]CAK1622614.1 hypothetical protein AOBTE_LOCUS1594 [Acanthoscelides obtectus]